MGGVQAANAVKQLQAQIDAAPKAKTSPKAKGEPPAQ